MLHTGRCPGVRHTLRCCSSIAHAPHGEVSGDEAHLTYVSDRLRTSAPERGRRCRRRWPSGDWEPCRLRLRLSSESRPPPLEASPSRVRPAARPLRARRRQRHAEPDSRSTAGQEASQRAILDLGGEKIVVLAPKKLA